METAVSKLIYEARIARGWSQEELASRAKVGQSTVDRIERGEPSKYETRQKVLTVLELTSSTQPAAAGNARELPQFFSNRHTMPVFASAEGGSDGALIIANDPYEYLPKPYTLENVDKAFAVLIEGESMVPAYEPGDKVWVNPMLSHRRNTDVILCGEGGFQGRALIKRLKSFTEGEWRVQQYNPAEEFGLRRAEWPTCYRVVGKFSASG